MLSVRTWRASLVCECEQVRPSEQIHGLRGMHERFCGCSAHPTTPTPTATWWRMHPPYSCVHPPHTEGMARNVWSSVGPRDHLHGLSRREGLTLSRAHTTLNQITPSPCRAAEPSSRPPPRPPCPHTRGELRSRSWWRIYDRGEVGTICVRHRCPHHVSYSMMFWLLSPECCKREGRSLFEAQVLEGAGPCRLTGLQKPG